MKHLLLIILSFCSFAHAGEFTIMGGASMFKAPDTGTYWNANQEHDTFMTPAAVGLRWDTDKQGSISYGIQYTHFGEVKIDALAVLTDAPFPGGYDGTTGLCTGPCAPLRRWRMNSEVQSVAFIVTKHYDKWSIEVGANLYEAKTDGNVIETRESEDYGFAHPVFNLGTNGKGYYQYPSARFLYIMPMFGVGYRDGPWSVRTQLWFMPTNGDTLAAFSEKGTLTILAGYSF